MVRCSGGVLLDLPARELDAPAPEGSYAFDDRRAAEKGPIRVQCRYRRQNSAAGSAAIAAYRRSEAALTAHPTRLDVTV